MLTEKEITEERLIAEAVERGWEDSGSKTPMDSAVAESIVVEIRGLLEDARKEKESGE